VDIQTPVVESGNGKDPPAAVPPGQLGEVAQLFLRLGTTAFGGPAAHIAIMHDEVVTRRKWVDDQHFLDLLGATNLIPGPNSTEMAIHLGYVRAGWRGLIVGGVCFVLPAMLIVMAIAWAYERFGSTPEASWLMYGIEPVVISIVVLALWTLGRKIARNRFALAVSMVVAALSLIGMNPIPLLIGGGVAAGVVRNARRLRDARASGAILPIGLMGLAAATAVPFSLTRLFLVFLKIGSVLYGSGYVLLAFLQADLVDRLGWITQDQLLTAVAIGQFTPGPLFTSATFIGYLLDGVPGALVATAGIFLPSFVFVAIANPFIPRLRASPWTAAILDGVNAASLGLMAAVTLQLARTALVDPLTVALAFGAGVLLFRFRINSVWAILAGAAVGLVAGWVQLRV
jgi:chromate transporter